MPYGPADAVDPGTLKRALVIKLRHHGDVLLASPTFSVLKNRAPQLEIDALVYADTRDMLSLHPAIARKVLQELAHPPQRPPTAEPLTEREVEVLRLIAYGESNQEIAAALGISEATVSKHVSHILSKLHLASRTQAALYALREGLASLGEAGAAA